MPNEPRVITVSTKDRYQRVRNCLIVYAYLEKPTMEFKFNSIKDFPQKIFYQQITHAEIYLLAVSFISENKIIQ